MNPSFRIGLPCYDVRDPRRAGRIISVGDTMIAFQTSDGRKYRTHCRYLRLGSPASAEALRTHPNSQINRGKPKAESPCQPKPRQPKPLPETPPGSWTEEQRETLIRHYGTGMPIGEICRLTEKRPQQVEQMASRLGLGECVGVLDPELCRYVRDNWGRLSVLKMAERRDVPVAEIMRVAVRLELSVVVSHAGCQADWENRDLTRVPELDDAMARAMAEADERPEEEAAWSAEVWKRAAAIRGAATAVETPLPVADDVFTRGERSLWQVFGPRSGRGGRRERHGPRMTVVGKSQGDGCRDARLLGQECGASASAEVKATSDTTEQQRANWVA